MPATRERLTFVLAALSFALLLATAASHAATTNVLVPAGALWKYLDDGSNPGTNWRAAAFNDTAWPQGAAQFGYGDGDEATVLNYGGNTNNRYITYYFRSRFVVTNAAAFTNLTLSVLRDDGAVVYFNGVERWRNNMPSGAITYTTRATTNVAGMAESTVFYSTNLSPSVLTNGTNVIAVEVHQNGAASADVSFNLRLAGVIVTNIPPPTTGTVTVTRGPYLQRGSRTNITVRWRTAESTASEVRFGTSLGTLDAVASEPTVTTNHEVLLTGLLPDTKYFYDVGVPGSSFTGDVSRAFVTAPAAAKPTRIWAIGDSGTKDNRPRSVYNAYRALAGDQPPDVWLMLGDNAYGSGTDTEYQSAVFNMYPEFLRQTVMWSTIGNHETYAPGATTTSFPFLNIYTQPTAGECGGVPSGTEKYFSFDYGDIHFICLDGASSSPAVTGPMCTWLQQDLEANTNFWVIAFWHQPPYTKGSHNSDSESDLIQIRQNVLPIIEAHGVDLVLCGHSHCYERSFLINGHYGSSGTLTASMKMDGGSGRDDDTGPYVKPVSGPNANKGTVYVVAGSSGQATFGSLNHPAMFFAELELGSLVLDIDGPVLQARFLRETGAIDDYFTIIKDDSAGGLRAISYVLADGTLTLGWHSRVDRSYQIERSATLAPASWTPLATGLPGTGATMIWNAPAVDVPPQAFFRVLEYVD